MICDLDVISIGSKHCLRYLLQSNRQFVNKQQHGCAGNGVTKIVAYGSGEPD
jgi:hypothetical protein